MSLVPFVSLERVTLYSFLCKTAPIWRGNVCRVLNANKVCQQHFAVLHSETYLQPEVACPNVSTTFELANAIDGAVVHVFVFGTYTGQVAPVSCLYLDMFKRKITFEKQDADQRQAIDEKSASKTASNRDKKHCVDVARAKVDLKYAIGKKEAEEKAILQQRQREEEEEDERPIIGPNP